MRKQDHLATLIKSLNAAEKRYFKLFATIQPGEKKYIKLFDLLASETQYDNAQLAKKLVCSTKQLAHEKEYLQKVLLKSLRNYNDEATPEITLESALIDIELLHNKKQYSLAQSLINKSMRIAEENEQFEASLRLLRWEKRCMREMGQYAYFEKPYSHILQKELQLIDKLENLLQIGALQYSVFAMINRNHSLTNTVYKNKMTSVIRHPLMRGPERAKSFTARILYYEIMYHWYTEHFEFEKSNNMLLTILNMMEENPHVIKQNPRSYFAMVSNHCGLASSLRKEKEGKIALDKMEHLLKTYSGVLFPSDITKMKASLILRKISYFNAKYDFKATAAFVESILPEIAKPGAGYTSAFFTSVYFRTSLSYFCSGNFDKALVFQRKVIDDLSDKVRIDNVFFTHILHFLTHFELRNYSLLPHLLKSLDRFMETRGFANEPNKLVVKFLGALVTSLKKTGKPEKVLRDYHSQLTPFLNDDTQNVTLDSLNLLRWMEEKIKTGIII